MGCIVRAWQTSSIVIGPLLGVIRDMPTKKFAQVALGQIAPAAHVSLLTLESNPKRVRRLPHGATLFGNRANRASQPLFLVLGK